MRITSKVIVGSVVALVLSLQLHAQTMKSEFDLPPQPLSESLKAVANSTDTNLVFDTDEVSQHMAPALKGVVTLEQALTVLLTGSGLQPRYLDDKTVVLDRVKTTTRLGKQRDGILLAQAERGGVEGGQQSHEGERLEEIVVTATKREERLQDVPISMSVVTAEDISRRGFFSGEDYLRGLPGVNQVDSGYSGQSIIIRGIETSPQAQNFGSGTTVATYFGETPTSNTEGLSGSSNIDLKLVDIERVEVLRGPQGTAFGNSSMGGAVRTIPIEPKLDRFGARVSAGYSATSGTGGDNYTVQAVGNIPLVHDKLAIRAVGYQSSDSGFYRNRAGSDAAFRANFVTPYGAEAFATDEDEVGSYWVRGGRIAAVLQASEALRFTLNYLSQKTEADGMALASSGTYEQSLLGVAPEHVFRGQADGGADTHIDLANAKIEYGLSWAEMLATYSHTRSGSTQSTPFATFGLGWPASIYAPGDHREDVGEIRLATRLAGAWNFLGGLYAEKIEDEVLNEYVWFGDPAVNPIAPGERFLSDVRGHNHLKQKAAYAEAAWTFMPRLTFTGGVRAYDYKREGRGASSGPWFGNATTDVGLDASGSTFRGNLSYKLAEDLGLLYLGWSQGFRLGRAQSPLPASSCDRDGNGMIDGTEIPIASTGKINSDEVDSYELGGKFTLLDRRVAVEVALFRMDWSGLPVFITAGSASTGCGLTYTANAGNARSEGVELQASYRISEAWSASAGGSWNHARLIEDVPAIGARAGDRLAGSPKTNANLSLQYEFDVGGHKASLRADSIYVGAIYGDLLQSPSLKSDEYVRFDVSARVSVRDLAVDLFVRNLTNEDAFTNRGIFPAFSAASAGFLGYRMQPRTVGLRLSYDFR